MACSVHRPIINSKFNKIFGGVINKIAWYAQDNKNKKRKQRDLTIELKQATDFKEKTRLKRELKSIAYEIIKSDTELKQYPIKFKALATIRDLIIDQADALMTSAPIVDINIDTMLQATHHLLKQRYGAFKHLNQMSAEDLLSIGNDLIDIYGRQDKSSGKSKPSLLGRFFGRYKAGQLSWWQDQVMDPVMAMAELDNTGWATKFVQDTKDFLSKSSSDANYFKDRMKTNLSRLHSYVNYQKYAYNVDDVNQDGERVITKSEEDRRTGTMENLVSLAHRILDGQTRRIIPTALFTSINGKPAKTAEFAEDEKEVFDLLDKAHTNHIFKGGNVQTYINPQTKEEFAYIPIRKEIDGRIVWRAYEIPMQTYTQEGGTTFKGIAQTPNTIDRQELWYEWFLGDKNEDGTPRTSRRMAGTTNLGGGQVGASMQEAWYSSQSYKPLVGYKIVKGNRQEIETQAYDDFVLSGESGDIYNTVDGLTAEEALPAEFYEFVDAMRKDLKSIYLDEVSSSNNANKELNRITTKAGLEGEFTKKELDTVINEVMGLDVNNNTWVKEGKVISAFKIMGERDDYSTWMFALHDSLRAFAKNIVFADANLRTAQAKYNRIVEMEGMTTPAALKAKANIDDKQMILDTAVEKRDIALALKEKHEALPMGLQDVIKYAKQRSGLLSPFPIMDDNTGIEVHGGRRLDFNVFLEYAENITKQMNQNHLKLNLLEASLAVDKPVRDYIIDQTKATMGRHDAAAGFLGLQYGTEHVANKIQRNLRKFPLFKNITVTSNMLYKPLHTLSSIISGSSLQMGSALNNNFQRLNTYAEIMAALNIDMEDLQEIDKDISRKVAEASGVTDVMTAIGDALIGSANKKMTGMTGFITIKDWVGIKLSKQAWMSKVRKSARWQAWIAEATKDLGLDSVAAAAKFDDVMDGIWEITNGVVEKKQQNKHFTKKERKALIEKTAGVISDDMVRQWTTWGLGGGILHGMFRNIGADRLLSFTGVEIKMREEGALMGAYLAWQNGVVPENWAELGLDSPLLHPLALEAGREMVNATMFGMSQQFLSKMFRGAIGQTLWKFKPYQWHQMRAEWKYIDTYRKSKSHLSSIQRKAEYAKLFNPNHIPVSRVEMRMKRFLTTRALWAVAGSLSHVQIPLLTSVYRGLYNVIRGITGQGIGPAVRGGSSVTIQAAIQMLFSIGALLDYFDDDEDEKIFQGATRMYFPMIINIFLEMYQKEDIGQALMLPLKLVAKPVAVIAEEVGKALSID